MPRLKYYNAETNQWDDLSATIDTIVQYTPQGKKFYMPFKKSNRTVRISYGPSKMETKA